MSYNYICVYKLISFKNFSLACDIKDEYVVICRENNCMSLKTKGSMIKDWTSLI